MIVLCNVSNIRSGFFAGFERTTFVYASSYIDRNRAIRELLNLSAPVRSLRIVVGNREFKITVSYGVLIQKPFPYTFIRTFLICWIVFRLFCFLFCNRLLRIGLIFR